MAKPFAASAHLAPPSPPKAPVAPPPSDLVLSHYTVCAIVEVLEGKFGTEDSLILPVPGLESDTVLVEPRDGHDIRHILCNEVEVRGGSDNRRLFRAPEIRARLLLTDARITVACSKFDKGGGWVGGPVAMLALNAGSKLLAANRRRGKMLVGQIRYPWIDAVYAQNKSGWRGGEMMRVIVQSGGQAMRLELTFPKDVDATAVATELIRRAARFRLTHEPGLDQASRVRLTDLSNIAPLVWRKEDKKMVGHEFPSPWVAGEESARIGLSVKGA
jgi:hypothetical protein